MGDTLFIFLGAIVAFVIALVVGAVFLLWAWNVFMPAILGLPGINFWQALALSFLLGSIGRPNVTTSR